MSRYTVFGCPITHSKSPRIHQLFAAQEGVHIEYTRTHVDIQQGAFQAAVHDFFEHGGHGANVTLPFKETALTVCQHISERARTAGAINTLIAQPDGSLLGDNTDGIGLVYDLYNFCHFPLSGSHILILGAGGAARGIILPLLACQPERITLANRTFAKADVLAQQFNVHAQPFRQLSGSFDLIINATASSLSGSIPNVAPQIFSSCVLAYDLFYAKHQTMFMKFAAEHGAMNVCDGLGMLVGQAAAAYQQWRGFSPDIAPIITALRTEMSE